MIRLRVPDEGECVVDDLVRGDVRFEYAQLGDHVILRSDGVPTYNFANPIDDADMGITHVIRGEDLLSSTPRQVLVYQALGAPVPSFAHLPLLFGPDRKRLSKRHGATSVEELREAGYLAEAVVNFLALLGWHFDSERELFTRAELIGLFSLERVNPAPGRLRRQEARVDERRLPARAADVRPRRAPHRLPRGSAARRSPRSPTGSPRSRRWRRRRSRRWPSSSRSARSSSGPIEIEQEAWDKVAGHERAAEILAAVQAALADLRVDGGGRRGDAARRLRAARAQAARRLRPRPRRRHRHEHLAGPVRERAPARPRRGARAPRDGRRPPRLAPRAATRCATTARQRVGAGGERAALARGEGPERRSVRRAPARGVRARAPGQRRERPECELRGAAGDGPVRAPARAAMSERVSPYRRPAA